MSVQYQPMDTSTPGAAGSVAASPYYRMSDSIPQTMIPSSYFPPVPQPVQQPYPHRPPSPELAAVTPDVASHAIRRLATLELRDAGFVGSEPDAMLHLEREIVAFIENLYKTAHEYANLAGRSHAIATDLKLAGEDNGLDVSQLRPVKRKAHKRKKNARGQPRTGSLVPPESRSPSPELLPSDDEDVPVSLPSTLRSLPVYYPALPPKHTYLQTPASPPRKVAVSSLEKKLQTAGLVQESLKNLMTRTEETHGQADAQLLGHTVNWETNVHPRRKWKFGS